MPYLTVSDTYIGTNNNSVRLGHIDGIEVAVKTVSNDFEIQTAEIMSDLCISPKYMGRAEDEKGQLLLATEYLNPSSTLCDIKYIDRRQYNQIIQLVEKIYSNGHIHHDLNPSNILFSKNRFWIVDWGDASINYDYDEDDKDSWFNDFQEAVNDLCTDIKDKLDWEPKPC